MKIKFKVYDGAILLGEEVLEDGNWQIYMESEFARHGVFSEPSHEFTRKQFTNFLDRKGNEIYDGDIVEIFPNEIEKETYGERLGNCKFEVRWDNSFGAWTFKNHSVDDWNFVWFWEESKEIEVIGNVIENPELLK